MPGFVLEIGKFLRDTKVMVRFDPSRPDFSPYGFSCVRWTPTTMSRCDRHNEIELNLLEGGRLDVRFASSQTVMVDLDGKGSLGY